MELDDYKIATNGNRMTTFRPGRDDGSEQGRSRKQSKNDQVSKVQTTQPYRQLEQILWKRHHSQLIYVYMGLLKTPQDIQKLKVFAFLLILRRYISLHRQSLYGIISILGSITAINNSSSRMNHVAFCYQRIHAYMQHMSQYYSPSDASAKLQNRGWTKFQTLLIKNHGQFVQKIEERHQTQIAVYQNTLEEQSREITAMQTTTTITTSKKPIRMRPIMNESDDLPSKKRPLFDCKNVDNFLNKKSRRGSPPLNEYHDYKNDDIGKHRISQFLKSFSVARSNHLEQSTTPKKNNESHVAMPSTILTNSGTKNEKDETPSNKYYDGDSLIFSEEVNNETTNSNSKDYPRNGTLPPVREETIDSSSSSCRSPSIESTSISNNLNHWRIWDLFVHFAWILLEYGLWTLLFIVAILNIHVPMDTWA